MQGMTTRCPTRGRPTGVHASAAPFRGVNGILPIVDNVQNRGFNRRQGSAGASSRGALRQSVVRTRHGPRRASRTMRPSHRPSTARRRPRRCATSDSWFICSICWPRSPCWCGARRSCAPASCVCSARTCATCWRVSMASRVAGAAGRCGRDQPDPEQHRHLPDRHLVPRPRAGHPVGGAGGDAGRRRRHRADGGGVLVRPVVAVAAADLRRRGVVHRARERHRRPLRPRG